MYSILKRLQTIDDFDIERFGAAYGVAYEMTSVHPAPEYSKVSLVACWI